MLALTADAQQAIGGILEQADPGAGIRIAPGAGDNNGDALQLTVAPAPDSGDAVIESDGGPVFVDEAASTYLDDKVLDATVEQGQVQFELLAQAA